MVIAGIVTYNPNLEVLKNSLKRLQELKLKIIIVDNASNNIDEIQLLGREISQLEIIKNENNQGVATALNQVAHISEQLGADWILTLDQDSLVPLNILEEYMKHTKIKQVGIITPQICDINDKSKSNFENKNVVENVKKCITSASMTKVSVFKEVGYYDERMFIDLVDFDFCYRVIQKNYKIVRVNNVVLLHQLGELKIINFFKKKIYVTNHSPLRVYYYFRNSVYYQKKHSDLKESIVVNVKLVNRLFKYVLFEKNKVKKLEAVYKGVKDGLIMKNMH